MIIDGKVIADRVLDDVKKTVAQKGKPVTLAVVVVGRVPVIENFIALKTKKATFVGITIRRIDFSEKVETKDIVTKLKELASDTSVTGVIVQLPLPAHIDMKAVLAAIPLEKDADVLTKNGMERFMEGKALVFPPVVGAIKAICDQENVAIHGKKALVIGKGMLVGAPAATWLTHEGASVTIADKSTKDLATLTRQTDIIVSGAGVPGLITPNMLKDGVILFDAGTSEKEGVVKGDASPDCAPKCSLFTPIPGGIGPITIAILLQNTAQLMQD